MKTAVLCYWYSPCPPGGADASDEGPAGKEPSLGEQEEQGDRLAEERPAQGWGERDANSSDHINVH